MYITLDIINGIAIFFSVIVIIVAIFYQKEKEDKIKRAQRFKSELESIRLETLKKIELEIEHLEEHCSLPHSDKYEKSHYDALLKEIVYLKKSARALEKYK